MKNSNAIKLEINVENNKNLIIDFGNHKLNFNIFDLKDDDSNFDKIYDFLLEHIDNIEISLLFEWNQDEFSNLSTAKKIAIKLKDELENEINLIKENIQKIGENFS